VRVVQLQGVHVVAQVVGMLAGAMLVAVPEPPLDPFQRAPQACALGLVGVGDAARVLLQARQAHRVSVPRGS
jgi:hypothetical protein